LGVQSDDGDSQLTAANLPALHESLRDGFRHV
jgi:hypothetical protein